MFVQGHSRLYEVKIGKRKYNRKCKEILRTFIHYYEVTTGQLFVTFYSQDISSMNNIEASRGFSATADFHVAVLSKNADVWV